MFGDDSIQPYIDSMKVNNVPHQVMSGREANERYPQQLKLPEDYLCALEHEAGILRASKAVAVIQVMLLTATLCIMHCLWAIDRTCLYVKEATFVTTTK